MAAMYDIESFCVDLETFLIANLNTQIAAMNTEKSDSITLLTVPDAAFAFQTLNDKVVNYNPFVYYGIQNVESDGIGAATLNKYTIAVVLCVVDQGTDLLIGRRMLRYSRVLEDLIHSKFDRIGDHLNLKVSSLVPIDFKLLNSSDSHRAVGVEIEVTLA